MAHQLISDEKFTNIQRAQAGLTRLFEDAKESFSFYRVMKNDKPLGVLVPEDMWQNMTEDIEALSSPKYRAKIIRSRKDRKRVPAAEVKKSLGL